ncbi:Alpha carbonic anhydrase [Parasponia andersonii]|uniref:Alpha carbonic anhydrase n=1 Tax=Parasponia andersonii TaxID=3476 RepID=A0A2P5BJP6_PARAD|nr:Alpha carbonic anhydrase [Parasponia andersonii]
MQSPIDMLNHRVKALPKFGEPRMNYKPANATIRNRGHNTTIRTVSKEQVKRLRVSVHDYAEENARLVQPLSIDEAFT